MGPADRGGVWECKEGGDPWLEVSAGRDQVGGEGSRVVGESQLTPRRVQRLGTGFAGTNQKSVFRWAHRLTTLWWGLGWRSLKLRGQFVWKLCQKLRDSLEMISPWGPILGEWIYGGVEMEIQSEAHPFSSAEPPPSLASEQWGEKHLHSLSN